MLAVSVWNLCRIFFPGSIMTHCPIFLCFTFFLFPLQCGDILTCESCNIFIGRFLTSRVWTKFGDIVLCELPLYLSSTMKVIHHSPHFISETQRKDAVSSRSALPFSKVSEFQLLARYTFYICSLFSRCSG